MTDPVEVLARGDYTEQQWALLSHSTMERCRQGARRRLAALERAGFKVVARPPVPDPSTKKFDLIEGLGACARWDAAPTYGDKT